MDRPGLPVSVVTSAALALMLAGCGGNSRQEQDPVREVRFECENGESVHVNFHTKEERAVLHYGGQATELTQQRTGSGFYYTNARTGIRGKGDELLLEIGRRAPIRCRAVEQP